MSISDRLRAQAKNLRDIATILDAEAELHVERRADLTQSVVQHCQPLSLDTATAHEPKCDVCGGAKSQCIGVHSEGSRWPTC